MKRIWILTCLAACCAVLAAFLSFSHTDNAKILVVQDAFDPMADILTPYAGSNVERLTPYQLGQRLPGLNGMAFVFGTQARPYQKQSTSSGYVPLYNATVVIAVNRNGNSVGFISGWRTLLESEAIVLLPHHGTEGGRLTAIALARGLGAAEGDLMPAIEAFALLQSQARLNRQDVYLSRDYRAMYPPDRLSEHDAVVLWDYQAAMLSRISDDWDIILPEEGSFSVDCGFVYGGSLETQENLRAAKEFLLSEQGRQALMEAGFSPLSGEPDLSAWDMARLTYNPGFRRAVLSAKLYGPASVQERLLLQSITMLLFCIAAQRILRRIPRGLYRTTSLYSMLFVLLWMLVGIVKILSPYPDLTRYCWFATYISRHILPICWFCMCYVNRYERLPSRRSLTAFLCVAAALTVFVFTNDIHRLVFVYTNADPASWADQYINGWGYYLSSFWSFSLSIAGLTLLFHKNRTRQQKRQMLYAAIFFGALLIYQTLYIAGVKHILDLDIPTTVAIFILVFNLAAQRERFMRASLLELPIFQNSPYAIAIYNGEGQTEYSNAVMESLRDKEAAFPNPGQVLDESAEVLSGERAFKPYEYALDTGRALVLEDITYLKRLEQSLKETHEKLKAVQGHLVRQAEEARHITDRLEQERYSLQMDTLFKEKLEEVRRQLRLIHQADGENQDNMLLRRFRFLLCICQQRLRFIIRSLETHPLVPVELVEGYAAGVIRNGQRIGLDGVITAASRGFCPPGIVEALLESIDRICLYAFDLPGSSFICRLEADEAGIALNASLSWEGDIPCAGGAMLPENLIGIIGGLGGRILQEAEEDGLLTRLHFSYREVRG